MAIPSPVLSTTVLIKEYGSGTRNVCGCCEGRNLYELRYPGGEMVWLCSWCDLPYDDRWVR